MSLKTRCPACDTVFKIVPDQLKVSSGWVRCGRCAEVFDAASHAVTSDAATVWPQVSTLAASSVNQTTDASDSTLSFTPENIAIQAINTPDASIFSSNLTSNKSSNKQVVGEDEINLSFVRIAQSKAFWQRTSVVRSLRAACAGLIGLLFFQAVFSQRNHLAAFNPLFKTSLETLCQTLGCALEPFKNIDAFKIDSSSFQKSQQISADASQGENFALKLAIKNNTELAVAMPAVELTLTDTNDKPVLRRVLLAKNLGFNADTLAANSDWIGDLAVVVTPSSTKAAITGYRVLLFYP
jgi:predicted Zn finger-like uncharacterized protein